jgi:hypothetical protein
LRLGWDEPIRCKIEYTRRHNPSNGISALFLPAGRYDGPDDTSAFGITSDPANREFAALVAVTEAVFVSNDRHLLGGCPHPRLLILTPSEFMAWLDRESDGRQPGVSNAPSVQVVFDCSSGIRLHGPHLQLAGGEPFQKVDFEIRPG